MSSEANKPEPFGYFRATPFGWEDCAQGDDGAQALYDETAISTQAARIASLEAERDQLRVEVERLRPNALRYEFLRDDINSDWAICEWSHDEPDGIGYYRDARAPDVVDAAIDRAIEAAKEA